MSARLHLLALVALAGSALPAPAWAQSASRAGSARGSRAASTGAPASEPVGASPEAAPEATIDPSAERAQVGSRLAQLREEVDGLGKGIEPPDRSPEAARARASRKLIDAQVALGTGDYDTAAVMLYEYVDDHPQSRSYDAALFYLGEALFQRGDHLTARERFTELMQRIGPTSRHYQQALERLVELSLSLRDDTDVERWLAALDRLPPAQLRPSVHYVRGKYAYFRDRFQDAVQHFGQVPLTSEYFFQARYFMGVCYVALGSLQNAEAVYRDLIARSPARGDKNAPRVIELSHLALGRIFYETDHLVEAVDAYLEVDRKSDLFEDAAYEIAWVFVKQKHFDKALLAIELLAAIAPATSLVPSVEILEGNLRIRRAQAVSFLDADESADEYERALATFEDTRERFAVAHEELGRVMKEHTDPRVFLDQLAGRTAEIFEVRVTLPEMAAAWLRDHPEVQRVVAVEQNLEQVTRDVARSERAIERIEHALAQPARANVFPGLAKKRVRGIEIMEELFALRRRLARSERAFLFRHATGDERAALGDLEIRREALVRELALLPSGEAPYGERIVRAKNAFTALGDETADITGVVDAATAKLVALDKYLGDREAEAGRRGKRQSEKPARDGASMDDMIALREELEALRSELDSARRDLTLGKDRAGTGDEAALRGQSLRTELRRVLENEQSYMVRIAARLEGGNRARGKAIATILQATQDIARDVDALDRLIEEVVEVSLEDARSALVEEKAHLAAIKRELGDHEDESRELGGQVVGASFAAVKKKLYEILVRADVGVVDVGWSKKEDSDEALRRIDLDKLREQRMIDDDIRLLFGDEAAGKGKNKRARAQDDAEDEP
jgi:tetratricopeptide (TPR) repeat protein